MRLHIIFHTSRKTNHFSSTTLFSQDSECNANSQSRHTGKNHSGIALAAQPSLSISLSLFLSLCSLGLSRSSISVSILLYLWLRKSLYNYLFPSLYFCLSPPLAHTTTHSLDLTHFIYLSFFLSRPLTHSIRIT